MDKMLTAKETQTYLGVGRSTVYALLKRADFPSARLGRRIVVPESALREWLAKGGTQQK